MAETPPVTPPPDASATPPPPQPPLRRGGPLAAVTGAVLVGCLILLAAVTLGGRIIDDPPALLIAGVTFLPYLYAALTAVAFAVWCVWPDRRSPAIASAGTVVLGAVLWGPSWPARGEIADGTPLRIMEWNVQRLWGVEDDTDKSLRCVVDVVQSAEPDAMVLLEVSQEDVRTLEARLDAHCAHTDYRGTRRPDVGGIAVCTRGGDWQLKRGTGQRYVDSDDWHYLFTEVQYGSDVVNILGVHLYPYRFGDSARQLLRGDAGSIAEMGRAGTEVSRAQGAHTAALQQRVERFRDPTIMAGDFNSTRDAALHTHLRRHMTDAWERGGRGMGTTIRVADVVPLRIDYTYVTPQLAVETSEVIDAECSDHQPVVTQLSLRAPPAVP